MIDTQTIRNFFGTMQEFEIFFVKWTRTCAKLNKRSRNAKRLAEIEKRARRMQLDC